MGCFDAFDAATGGTLAVRSTVKEIRTGPAIPSPAASGASWMRSADATPLRLGREQCARRSDRAAGSSWRTGRKAWARQYTGAASAIDSRRIADPARRRDRTGWRRGAHCALPPGPRTYSSKRHAGRTHPSRLRGSGAEIVTANTFRTQARTLARAGLGARAAELTARAVEAGARRSAIQAAGWRARCRRSKTAGDPTSPGGCPRAEHAEHVANLAGAGVDSCRRTMNTIREPSPPRALRPRLGSVW
jgi:hypothetical protein